MLKGSVGLERNRERECGEQLLTGVISERKKEIA